MLYTKSQWGWASFDWAFQPFFTVVTTFIFVPYLTNTVLVGTLVDTTTDAQSLWGAIMGGVYAVIAVATVVAGFVANVSGGLKRKTLWTSALAMLFCASIWGLPIGMSPAWYAVFMVGMFCMATLFAEVAIIFNNAMLAYVIDKQRVGGLSGFAYGMSYVGGIISLGIFFVLFMLPETPAFGLNKQLFEPERFSTMLAVVWFAVFIVPFVIYNKEVTSTENIGFVDTVKRGIWDAKNRIANIRQHPNIWRFLLARMIYNNGILAVIAFAGIYASASFGWSTMELGYFAIILNVIAFLGAFLGGWYDDKIGAKRVIQIAIWCLIVGLVGGLSIDKTSIFFGLWHFSTGDNGFLSTPPQWVFLCFGALLGLGLAPSQSASRTLMIRITPKDKISAYFGIYGFMGNVTYFVLPFLIAVVTYMTDSTRWGIFTIVLFFAIGLGILRSVQEKPS